MDSCDIIAEAVRNYWKKEYPQDVVVFFYQKYDYETDWRQCEELAIAHSDSDYESITFLNDFCEGETDVKDIHIVPLWIVLSTYRVDYIDTQS